MANKCEVLTEARDQVVKNGRIKRFYCAVGCYCSVGYVLKGLGITDDELQSLGDQPIQAIYNQGRYPIHTTNELPIKVYRAVSNAEIDIETLCQIQKVNDESGRTELVATFNDILKVNCQ